jgi:hypothetical protein
MQLVCWQLPDMQVKPVPQPALVQPPQCTFDDESTKQPSVQQLDPVGQLGPLPQPHAPPEQVSPLWQECEHEPQWAKLVIGLTQALLQQICPAMQATPPHRHWPPMQLSPLAQTLPHLPQFAASSPRLRQPSEQQASEPVHTVP